MWFRLRYKDEFTIGPFLTRAGARAWVLNWFKEGAPFTIEEGAEASYSRQEVEAFIEKGTLTRPLDN